MGRYHRHSIDLTGPCCSDSFRSCLNGLHLATKVFQDAIGSASHPICEPIRHLRRGVEIQMIAPKVSAYHAAHASAAVGCAELIKLGTYSRGHGEASNIQCVCLFDALLKSSSCYQTTRNPLERCAVWKFSRYRNPHSRGPTG